jgi:hypothetical protein
MSDTQVIIEKKEYMMEVVERGVRVFVMGALN